MSVITTNVSPSLTTDKIGVPGRPKSWPPPSDFPILVDSAGRCVCKYGDQKWNLSSWAGHQMIINFGDGSRHSICPVNSGFLRQLTAWALWHTPMLTTASTVRSFVNVLRPIFSLCSKENIPIISLGRYPHLVDKLPEIVAASKQDQALTILHSIYERRKDLGFLILDEEGLRRFSSAITPHTVKQTAYIPPRIWQYQLRRLRQFLDDFLAHQQGLEACFNHCLEQYATMHGTISNACNRDYLDCRLLPFSSRRRAGMQGLVELSSFRAKARHFGIDELLARWCATDSPQNAFEKRGIMIFASYLSLANKVSFAYLLNFSMMRATEAWSLPEDCLNVESDEDFGPIFMLCGTTTKTVKDSDARWITATSSQLAVEVAKTVSRLRLKCCPQMGGDETSRTQRSALFQRSYEPWTPKQTSAANTVRSLVPNYTDVLRSHPCLFDMNELRITEDDLAYAKSVTPGLDPKIYKVGNIWPLAWHQLRRTGVVNMQASGLVSEESIQYQLKHASRAMSLYYGQGFSKVLLNKSLRTEYIQARYEAIGKNISELLTDRFVSPYGRQHKANILALVTPNDHAKLVRAAKAGEVNWRTTVLGGCTKRGPCPYGGVDNLSHCGGSKEILPCPHALFDKQRISRLHALQSTLDVRLLEAPMGSPYYESLTAQRAALENVTCSPRLVR